jgi:hypothetical protein
LVSHRFALVRVLGPLNLGQIRPRATAELALKKKSVRYYESQLDSRILPALGSICLCSLSRAQIEGLLSDLRRKGESGSTIRSFVQRFRPSCSRLWSAAISTRIRRMASVAVTVAEKPSARYYTPALIQEVLPDLSEPCRTVVLVAVHSSITITQRYVHQSVELLHGSNCTSPSSLGCWARITRER